MNGFYELWDVDTGNIIGTFETEADALGIVHDLIQCNDADYADDLVLGYRDRQGEWRSVATGAALAARADALLPERIGIAGIGSNRSR